MSERDADLAKRSKHLSAIGPTAGTRHKAQPASGCCVTEVGMVLGLHPIITAFLGGQS